VLGLVIRHSVLAVRLLANMFAGHLVLAVIVGFISATASSLPGIHFCVSFGIVYRHGHSSALGVVVSDRRSLKQ